MIGYKAFKKGMVATPTESVNFQYKVGGIYEEPEANVGKNGFHFCKTPLDVFKYYSFVDSQGDLCEFAKVESIDDAATKDGVTFAAKRLKINSKISFDDLLKDSMNLDTVDICNVEIISANGASAALDKNDTRMCLNGDDAKINISGHGCLTGARSNRAKIGIVGDVTQIRLEGCGSRIGTIGCDTRLSLSGYGARIGSSGYNLRIGSDGDNLRVGSSGNDAVINTKGYGALVSTCGDHAQINCSGENSIISCVGVGSVAKSSKGSWITLAEWKYSADKQCNIPVCVKTEYVDGERIKADTYYELKNGDFTEVEIF